MKARVKTLYVNDEVIKIRTSLSRSSGSMNAWNVTINGQKWIEYGDINLLTGEKVPFENFEERREAAELAAYTKWLKLPTRKIIKEKRT